MDCALKMEKEELISVIVPVYNVEKYLNKCIDSLISQTYQNLEIILVDDGSTDNSGKICDRYEKQDNRIIVIHKVNGGVSSARNAGLSIAHGKYISFVDADDYILCSFYKKMYKGIITYNTDLAICPYEKVDSNDLINKKCNEEMPEEIVDCHLVSKECVWKWSFINPKNYGSGLWNKLFKADIWGEIVFNIKIAMGEDNIALVEYLLRCKSVSCVNERLYKYVVNPSSATNTFLTEEQLSKKIAVRIDATDIMLSKVSEESEFVKDCVFCRSIRDNLWAVFRMAVCGMYIKSLSGMIRDKTVQGLRSYIRVTEDIIIYKGTVILMAISPYLVYILGRLFYKIMPLKMMHISKL